MPATHPNAINAARRLLKTLFNQRRGPKLCEFREIDAALEAADGRTRLDPSKRRGAAKAVRR
jgi:hypothetical protein